MNACMHADTCYSGENEAYSGIEGGKDSNRSEVLRLGDFDQGDGTFRLSLDVCLCVSGDEGGDECASHQLTCLCNHCSQKT